MRERLPQTAADARQEPDQPQGLSSRENHRSGALHRLRVLRRHVPRLRYHRGKVGKAYG